VARAAFRYNHSDYYVQLVMSFQHGYQTGVFAVPSPPPPPAPAPKKKATVKHAAHHTKTVTQHHTSSAPKPAAPAQPKPTTTPKPTPKPTPAPTPSAPKLATVDGTWQACGTGFCLGTTNLDLGSPSSYADRADADFDGDGTVETNALEFAGLVDQHVTLQVVRNSGSFVVYVIGAHGYRNADGSFARTLAAGSEATTAP
jgi:hypothetical protein